MLLLCNSYAFTSPPSYPPIRGRLYTFFGLRFPNCVSAIFHSSLFTKELKFQVTNMLLISNKISINKNKQIYFFLFSLIFLY